MNRRAAVSVAAAVAAAVTGALALGACGGVTVDVPGDAGASSAASIDLGLSVATGFIGNALEICAKRGEATYANYACLDELPCTCVGFDATGLPVVGGEPARFDDLCPSTDLPAATWQFDYVVYSDVACAAGTALTGGDSPAVTCYDLSDLATRSRPNGSILTLLPGVNENTVVCIVGGI